MRSPAIITASQVIGNYSLDLVGFFWRGRPDLEKKIEFGLRFSSGSRSFQNFVLHDGQTFGPVFGVEYRAFHR